MPWRLCLLLLIFPAAALAAGDGSNPPLANSSRLSEANITDPDSLEFGAGDSLGRVRYKLPPINITATRASRDEPAGMTHVTPTVIRRTPSFDPYDLMRQAAGLEVHSQGQGPGFASDASIRGFSSDHSTDIALWIDGVPNNEPVNGHAEGYNDWNLLFPEAIEGIDVLKGPTSALYGNFAMSGVVNVQTLERLQRSFAWLSSGSYGRIEGGALAGYDHGTDGGVFGVRGVHEDGWRPNSDYTLGQGHGRIIHALSSAATLDAGVELYSTKWKSPGFLSDSAFQAEDFHRVENETDGGFKNRAQERVSLRVRSDTSLIWRSTVYATQGRWQLFLTIPPEPGSGEGTGSQTEEEDHRYGFGLTSALTWILPRSELTVGTEGRWDHSHYENWLTTDRARDSSQVLVTARQASGALFLQSTTELTNDVRVTLGGRWDFQDTKSTSEGAMSVSQGHGLVSPKLGALYRLSKAAALYANVSRGFRSTDGVIEDPTLPFITAWAYEAGIKMDGRHGSSSIALYRMDVSNEQTFDPITASSTSGGESRRQGVELSLATRPIHGVTMSGDWTFNDARYRRLITEDGDTLNGARVFNTAKYVGTIALELSPSAAPWDVRVSSNIVGPYSPFDEPGVVLPAYGLLHLSGGIRLGDERLRLGVRNVLDRSYPELRAAGFVSPGQPRSVFGSVEHRF